MLEFINPLEAGQQYADPSRRLDLVNRFNLIVGTPSKVVDTMQRAFVAGQMTENEADALIRLYEYTIDAVESAKRP